MNRSERAKQIRQQSEELAKIAAKKIGASAWYDNLDPVLTAEEKQEVMALWKTMSGSSCWMGAFFVWFNDQTISDATKEMLRTQTFDTY